MASKMRMRSPLGIFLAVVAIGFSILLVTSLISLRSAINQPTGEDTSVKLAEWTRDHGLGFAVTAAENIQYRLSPPATGGTPDTALLKAAQVAKSGVALQPALVTPAKPALPGEGEYLASGPQGHRSDLQITYLRPDSVHTSYLTGVAWMSHNDRFVLHPGYQEPGLSHTWTQPDQVSATGNTNLLATFNSGFKLKDANGGYYDNGQTAGKLVDGAASFVVYRDGHATVGTWGTDVKMDPTIAFVRQNLKPLITNGSVATNLNTRVESTWGATIGGDLAVWRSGVGVTSTGDIVYAMGDALTVQSLADILHRAGSVNAMQLDINRAWISFMSYRNAGGTMVPKKMGTFQRPADRYLQPTSRDFVAVYSPTDSSAKAASQAPALP